MSKIKLYFKSDESYNIDFQGSKMILSQGMVNSSVPFSLKIGSNSNIIVEGETVESINLGEIQSSNGEIRINCGFNTNYVVEFIEDGGKAKGYLRIGKTFVGDVDRDLLDIPYLQPETLRCYGSPDFISMKITKDEIEISDSSSIPHSNKKSKIKEKFVFRIESEDCLKLAFNRKNQI